MLYHDAFNPTYPDLGIKIARLRSAARRDPGKRREHGEAVLEAIRRLQRSSLQRELPGRNPHCASGTAHNDGLAILAAVREQNRRAALRY